MGARKRALKWSSFLPPGPTASVNGRLGASTRSSFLPPKRSTAPTIRMLALPRELCDASDLAGYNTLARLCSSIAPPPGRLDRTPIKRLQSVIADVGVTSYVLPNGTRHGTADLVHLTRSPRSSITVEFDRGRLISWNTRVNSALVQGRIGCNIVVRHYGQGYMRAAGVYKEMELHSFITPSQVTMYGAGGRADVLSLPNNDFDSIAAMFARWVADSGLTLAPVEANEIPEYWADCLAVIAPDVTAFKR